MKVGLIRCMQTEDMCPGTTDFKVMKEKKCAFEGIEEEIEVIGVNTCGGCPGKKAVIRAAEMVKRGSVVWFFKLKPILKNMCGKLEGNIQYDNRAIAKTVESYFVKSLT